MALPPIWQLYKSSAPILRKVIASKGVNLKNLSTSTSSFTVPRPAQCAITDSVGVRNATTNNARFSVSRTLGSQAGIGIDKATANLCPILSQLSISPINNCCKSSISLAPLITNTSRNVTKASLLKGRRKTVAAVKYRFMRLDWGGWISARPGRARKLWRRRGVRRLRLKHHILRNEKESELLDKMCTKYWVKKKYFVDDPYESYHKRDYFPITKGVQGISSIKLWRVKKFDMKRPIK